jgi:hypothetical protein
MISEHSTFLETIQRPINKEEANILDRYISSLLLPLQRKVKSDVLTLYRRFLECGGYDSDAQVASPVQLEPSRDTAKPNQGDLKEAMSWAELVRHLVRECINFDKNLLQNYGYRCQPEDDFADGPCLSVLTEVEDRFLAWVSIERFRSFPHDWFSSIIFFLCSYDGGFESQLGNGCCLATQLSRHS